MRRSVKTITLASIFGSLTILAVLAVASWDRILEGWYLQQLSSSDKEAQLRAAERLVELESIRAIPKLIELVGQSETEVGHSAFRFPAWGFGRVTTQAATKDWGGGLPGDGLPSDTAPERILLTPLAHSLYRIGSSSSSGATPAQRKRTAAELLRDHQGKLNEALLAVRDAWYYPRASIERQSAEEIREAIEENQREMTRRMSTW